MRSIRPPQARWPVRSAHDQPTFTATFLRVERERAPPNCAAAALEMSSICDYYGGLSAESNQLCNPPSLPKIQLNPPFM